MRIPLVAIALIGLSACGIGNSEPRDTAAVGTRAFSVGSFKAVSLDGSDDVRIVRGPVIAVSATGSQRVLDALDIRVKGESLKIGRKATSSYWARSKDRGAVITVTMPMLAAAAVAGSGNMAVDRIEGEGFSAAVDGSGNLRLASMTVKRAEFAVGGSGNLFASGTATDTTMAAQGSGNIEARGLASARATIAVEGSGNVTATVRERATIAIEGSGDVDVTGTDNCTIAREGSGSARCVR